MKHLSYILIAITSIVVGFADAQVLPKPVISPEPATVRIIEKNTDSDMSVGIHNHIALPIKSQTTFLNLVKEKEGVCTYEGEVHIDMTTYANIIHSRDNESVTIAGAILVPGKTTTMTYDNKTKSVSFKGQFAKLNKDITDYLHIDSLHNLYKDCDPSSIKSSYHRYCKTKTPEEMRDMLYRRYKKAERAIDSDKRFGAEFKEWWRAQIAAEVADKMYWYEYDYSDEHSEYKVGQYLRFCWDEIDPRKGYATFYLQNNASLASELVLFYDDYYGKGTLLPEVEHLVAASDIAYEISYRTCVPEKTIETMCKDFPEYYPILLKKEYEKRARLDSISNMPYTANFCTLDRTLEGEDIIKRLLSMYNNGKPTIIIVYFKGKAPGIEIKIMNEIGDNANYAILTGGKDCTDKDFFNALRESKGDFYYLTNYQIEYLRERYKGNEFVIVMAFDTEGNLKHNPETFTWDSLRESLKEALFK